MLLVTGGAGFIGSNLVTPRLHTSRPAHLIFGIQSLASNLMGGRRQLAISML